MFGKKEENITTFLKNKIEPFLLHIFKQAIHIYINQLHPLLTPVKIIWTSNQALKLYIDHIKQYKILYENIQDETGAPDKQRKLSPIPIFGSFFSYSSNILQKKTYRKRIEQTREASDQFVINQSKIKPQGTWNN